MSLWPTAAFWTHIEVAVLMAEAELMPIKYDQEMIETGVLRALLEWAPVAGNA